MTEQEVIIGPALPRAETTPATLLGRQLADLTGDNQVPRLLLQSVAPMPALDYGCRPTG